MKLIDVIQKLESQGYSITKIKRSDGSYRVTEIKKGTLHLKGSASSSMLNNQARALAGERLSAKAFEQRSMAGAEAKATAEEIRKGTISKNGIQGQTYKEKIKKAQRILRKIGKAGKVKTRTFKKYAKREGIESAINSLQNIIIHAKKKAYPSQIEALIEYAYSIDIDDEIMDGDEFVTRFERLLNPFKRYDAYSVDLGKFDLSRLLDNDIVKSLYQVLYSLSKGEITCAQALHSTRQLIASNTK